jgi:hypothetical protein
LTFLLERLLSEMRVTCRTFVAHVKASRLARSLRDVRMRDAGGQVNAIDLELGKAAAEKRQALRLRQWMDLLSALLMAAATVATAWSAYQSSLWNGQYAMYKSRATNAAIKVGKLSTLALQRTSVHVNLFVHWVSAMNRGDTRTADFLAARFPEPLEEAVEAWRATNPFENPQAPVSPFDMPQYVLQERVQADRWERIGQDESAAAEHANETANRYLLFTIIYASVLFFAGISGKFRWQAIDITVLVLGAVTLLAGIVIMIASPRL